MSDLGGFEIDFSRYLESKRSLDGRSLSPRILDSLVNEVPRDADVLELGAGTGAGSFRLLERGVAVEGNWSLLDQAAPLLDVARSRLKSLSSRIPLSIETIAHILGDPAVPESKWDLVFAQAVLDLFDLGKVLAWIRRRGRAKALFYFSLNFDGLSVWEPEIDKDLDERIALAYHRSMETSGDSRCGRHLFNQLPAHGFEILDADSSDWAVWPRNGRYPGDEQYFLRCLLSFYRDSVAGRPEVSPRELDFWLTTRENQIEKGEAVFMAHQWDFLAR